MSWTFYNASGQKLAAIGYLTATQAEMETATSTATYVTPGRTQYHPGVAKVWCHITAAGGLSAPDHGVATVGDTGAGDRDVNFTTAFSGVTYIAVSSLSGGAAGSVANSRTSSADVTLLAFNASGSALDEDHDTIIMGDLS